VIAFPVCLAVYLLIFFIIVAFENSGRFIEAAAVTVVAVLLLEFVRPFPATDRPVQRWAAGQGKSAPVQVFGLDVESASN
jgi:adenylate cyclase